MKQQLSISLFAALALMIAGCRTPAQTGSPKPGWVSSRPSGAMSYIGIGNASKKAHPLDYQQIAKKNALDDLVSEIKVTVSTNSVLQQRQTGGDFTQQFNATTRTTALSTIEHFEVVGSWETADEFWIYYRLSKEEYEAAARRKRQGAIDRAEALFARSKEFSTRDGYMQSLHLKVAAISSMQAYLNEDIGLTNSLFASIQEQLYQLRIVPAATELKGTIGKALVPFVDVKVMLADGTPVPHLPMRAVSEGAPEVAEDKSQTDEKGVVTFSQARVLGKGQVQFLRVAVDLGRVMTFDSMSAVLRSLLISIPAPSTAIRVNAEPLKVYLDVQELNLSAKSDPVLQPLMAKALTNTGCTLQSSAEGADYIVRVRANTISSGAIWGNMQSALLEISVSVTDAKTRTELHKEISRNIKGYQTTPAGAGLDAYKKAASQQGAGVLAGVMRTLFGN